MATKLLRLPLQSYKRPANIKSNYLLDNTVLWVEAVAHKYLSLFGNRLFYRACADYNGNACQP